MPEDRTGMALGQMRSAVGKQFLSQAAGVISRLVGTPALQLGHHQIDKVDVALRGDDAGQVEAVEAGFSDP